MPNPPSRWLAYLLTSAQFLLIGVLVWRLGATASSLLGLVSQAGGLLLGVWALWVMRGGPFSVFPLPTADARVVQRGPYAQIRHPMYTAIALVITPLLWQADRLDLLLGLLLAIDLYAKSQLEEYWLGQKLSDYASYRASTKRFIPRLW